MVRNSIILPYAFKLVSSKRKNKVMNDQNKNIESLEKEIASLREELATQKALWRELVDCVPAGVMVLDKTGKIQHVNRNATAMFDIKSPNAAGRHYADVMPQNIAEEIRHVRTEVTEHGFVINRILNRSIEKGIDLSLGVNASVFSAGHEPLTVIVCHDRTAVSELERLRALDAKKTESISRAAHELKNPLSAVKAYCEVLTEMYAADETAVGFIKGIDNEADLLLRLVAELLNVSSIESGRMNLTLDELDIVELVRQTLHAMTVTSKKHCLVLRAEKDMPSVIADQLMMKEVVTNLVSNAINFSPEAETSSSKSAARAGTSAST